MPPNTASRRASSSAAPLKPDREKLAHVANLFRVFSEPTRLAILQMLREQPLSVNELVERLETSQANVSKQLKTLHDADLLRREQRGTYVYYSIKEEMVYELCEIVCNKLNRTARANAETDYRL